jgi:hypothetical protein
VRVLNLTNPAVSLGQTFTRYLVPLWKSPRHARRLRPFASRVRLASVSFDHGGFPGWRVWDHEPAAMLEGRRSRPPERKQIGMRKHSLLWKPPARHFADRTMAWIDSVPALMIRCVKQLRMLARRCRAARIRSATPESCRFHIASLKAHPNFARAGRELPKKAGREHRRPVAALRALKPKMFRARKRPGRPTTLRKVYSWLLAGSTARIKLSRM